MSGYNLKEIRVCLVCFGDFTLCKPTSTTCSRHCANVYVSERSAAKRSRILRGLEQKKIFEPTNCIHCNRLFAPKNDGQINCSIECANEEQRKRGNGIARPSLQGRLAHRVVMEQILGRPLTDIEVVHHKNNNYLDYSPENLQLMPSQAEHIRLHNTKNRKCEIEGCGRKHMAHGMCATHYSRWCKYGKDELERPIRSKSDSRYNKTAEVAEEGGA